MPRKNAPSDEKSCVEHARAALSSMTETRSVNEGTLLFRQGDNPESVFFLRSGCVHMERRGLASMSDLCVAKAGDVIGVTNAISGRSYDMSAVVTEAGQVEIVGRAEFLEAMTASPGLHLEVVRMLSIDLGRCYEVLRTFGPKTRNRHVNESTL